MRVLLLLLVCALLLALTAGVATEAASAGNSANAQACQKGGWQLLKKADGGRFASQAECVNYGAQGGVVTPLAGESVCGSLGGTFGTGPDLASLGLPLPPGFEIVWVCNDMAAPDIDDYRALAAACIADGGTHEVFTAGPSFHYTCLEQSV